MCRGVCRFRRKASFLAPGPPDKPSGISGKTKGPRLKLTFQPGALFGAADEARTRYLHLGKVALYQMSYGRIKKSPKMGSVIFVGCPSPT